MARIAFAAKMLMKYVRGQPTKCPNCNSSETGIIGRKWALVQVRRCDNCRLMFRYPKDTVSENWSFYQQQYKENGITSELPSLDALREMVATSFVKTNKDFVQKISILKQFKGGGRVLDFGCSWGYGMWQLQSAGYEMQGFEISQPRARFGRENLGLDILSTHEDLNRLPAFCFDAIVTNHVLEHLPEFKSSFDFFRRVLKRDGVLLIFVPNCTGLEKRTVFQSKKIWAFGEKHPMALDVPFFRLNLPLYEFDPVFDTSPYDLNCLFQKDEVGSIEGEELAVLARKA